MHIFLADVSCFPMKIHPKKTWRDRSPPRRWNHRTELPSNCHEPSLGARTALRTVVPRADLGAGGAVGRWTHKTPTFVVGNFIGIWDEVVFWKSLFFWQMRIMWCVGMWACMLIYGDCWWFMLIMGIKPVKPNAGRLVDQVLFLSGNRISVP